MHHISDSDYRPQRVRKLARDMGVQYEEYQDFRAAVKHLMKAGRVVKGTGNCVMLPDAGHQIIGSFRGNPRGFGFVVPESPSDHEDLYIPKDATSGAITGDKVMASISRRGRRGRISRIEGVVVEIVERGQSRFVGELVKESGQWLMIPDGNLIYTPIILSDVLSTRAKAGDQVVVEITQFPTSDALGRGVIVEVLGQRGDPGVDTVSIIRQYHFRDEFPDKVIKHAGRAIRKYDLDTELARREDLRDQVVITIDPDDAKDFDDAISIRRTSRGQLELGIHIADVSTLVNAGSPMDEEAAQRGNSVYFPRHVIPMLPEVLSNGLCSLQEGESRLAKSVFIRYDGKGNRKARKFANTVIKSNKRLTYNQATKILAGKTRGYKTEVVSLLKDMDKLARLIQKRRLTHGMIVLDLPSAELVLDEDGKVVDVQHEDTSFSHTIIEMFMVEANEAVAELFAGLNVPHLRRVHPEPPVDTQDKLINFVRTIGRPSPKKLDRFGLIKLLDNVRGRPESFTVNLAILKSMSQAEYAPQLIGHYALASRHYSHFTSPIRRYPDLVIHRLLEMYLAGKLKTPAQRKSAPSEDTLAEIGKTCSYTERRAEDAERELKLVKILDFLEDRIGDVEEGVVTGVTNVGLFVQLRKYLIDGLIRFDDLPDDWWDIDVSGNCVIGQRSGKCIAIGDQLQVQIAAVDVTARKLDLALATRDFASTRPSGGKKAKPEKKLKRKKRPKQAKKRSKGKRR
ncbi:MAG: ribonuclease R [Planctomycetota bacterium]